MLSKRIPKRSIGTRVSALFPDGIFYPVVIRNVKTQMPTGEVVYEVLGEDGVAHTCRPDMMVGPGFLPVSNTHLKFNQPVYTTLDGLEVRAIVQKHRKQTNEVLLKSADAAETNFKRKLDDVRLLESRKTVKLMDHHSHHYHHHHHHHDIEHPESKKRPVSTNIEVPSAKSQKVLEDEPPMDDVMAAMVLTSLFGSPQINRERNPSGDSVLSGCGPMSPASSLSSGYGNVSPSPSPSISTHFNWDVSRSTPSPSSSNSDMESSSCPPFNTAQGSIPSSKSSALFSSSIDEGIDISGGGIPFSMDDTIPDSPAKKFKASVKTSYKCTWQGCGKTLSTVQGIERHIRTIHLRKKEGEEYSDHEEEFYYTEIDTTVESVSDTLANMFTSSPPPSAGFTMDQSHLPTQSNPQSIPNHPMEVSTSPAPIVSKRGRHLSTSSDIVSSSFTSDVPTPPMVGSLPNQAIAMLASPMTVPNNTAQFSWCPISTSTTSFSFPSSATSSSTSSQPLQPPASVNRMRHKSAPHSTAGQPKIRSEGKKCRKVYGMENKDMWCTQCRWKKACVRFT